MELLSIIAIFLSLYLLSRVKGLEDKVETMERTARSAKDGQASAVSRDTQQQTPIDQHMYEDMPQQHTAQAPASQPYMPQVSEHTGPSSVERFFAWLKEDFFVKAGAFLLLLGFGWFVSYAFANDWVGPMGRITLGLLVGASILALGQWRIRTYLHQGGIFITLGSTTILLTVWAARELYDMFNPVAALAIMFFSVVFVAFASIQYKSKNLAFASLVLASVAPLLTNTPAPDVAGLFSYLLVVVLGTLWVVYVSGWRELPFAALIVVFLYGLPYLMLGVNDGEKDIALFFSFIFTAIFFIANIVSILRQGGQQALKANLLTGIGTGLYIIAWITAAAPDVWRSLLYVAWMLVFALGTFVVYRGTAKYAPFYLYSGISVALLGAATAAELSGPALTIGYTIEIAVILILATSLTRNIEIVKKLSWLYAVPIALSFESIASSKWSAGFLHDDFFALIVLAFALLISGAYTLDQTQREEEKIVPRTLLALGTTYAFILVWQVLHSIMLEEMATMVSLFIYTVVGIVAFVTGKIEGNDALRIGGAVVIGAVIMRLLFVDVWSMELAGRIVTFLVIGVLLISTAFIGGRSKQEHLTADESNQYRS